MRHSAAWLLLGMAGSAAVAQAQQGAAAAAAERLGRWLSAPTQPPQSLAEHLPAARPVQPWPYRPVPPEAHVQLLSHTGALVASVQHAPLRGVTAAMLAWWFAGGVNGSSRYVDGSVWPHYLQWHPRDHVAQADVTPPGAARPRWRITEFIMASEPGGFTQANYSPRAGEFVVSMEAEVLWLNASGLQLGLPHATGLGSTFWSLTHTWADSPEGAVVTSRQVVGVEQPGWRPLYWARIRNALLRGLMACGQEPEARLRLWLRHCVEEFGNFERLLPQLFAASTTSQSAGAARRQQAARLAIDEL